MNNENVKKEEKTKEIEEYEKEKKSQSKFKNIYISMRTYPASNA